MAEISVRVCVPMVCTLEFRDAIWTNRTPPRAVTSTNTTANETSNFPRTPSRSI